MHNQNNGQNWHKYGNKDSWLFAPIWPSWWEPLVSSAFRNNEEPIIRSYLSPIARILLQQQTHNCLFYTNKYLYFSLTVFWVFWVQLNWTPGCNIGSRHALCISVCVPNWKGSNYLGLSFLWWQKKDKRVKLLHTDAFKASCYVKSTNITLTKISHMSKLKIMSQASIRHPPWGRVKRKAA